MVDPSVLARELMRPVMEYTERSSVPPPHLTNRDYRFFCETKPCGQVWSEKRDAVAGPNGTWVAPQAQCRNCFAWTAGRARSVHGG